MPFSADVHGRSPLSRTDGLRPAYPFAGGSQQIASLPISLSHSPELSHEPVIETKTLNNWLLVSSKALAVCLRSVLLLC